MTNLINNRYKIIQELGHGGMASVYLVEDTAQNNTPMALKQIRADLLGSRNLAQFKYEFAALKALSHPNLVTVYDFEILDEGKLCYFTMAYIPGQDLSSLTIEHQGDGDFKWLYDIIVQTCRALQYIHARGLIHYDIKPHNIRCTPNNQVKLMDFGLIDKATDEVHLSIRGTPEYMAPELIRGHQVDHRVDLYALGITLYEVLTGRLPFTGDSTTAILKQHLTTPPPPPQNMRKTVPPALQELTLTLIAKTPLKRFNNANEVIQAVNEISGLNYPLETKETKQAYLQSGRFVGRDDELAHLHQLLSQIQRSHGRLVLISGDAGVGKTRLAHELKLRAQLEGCLVFESLSEAQAPAPYQPWLPILNQIIAYQQRHQPDSLQVYVATLAELLPGLTVKLKTAPTLSPIASDKNNLLEASARLLQTTQLPLLIILDNLHHADPETIHLLDYLGEQAPKNKWLLCGIYQDTELSNQHPLRNIINRARVINTQSLALTPASRQPYDLLSLSPFNSADMATFVQSMLGVSNLPQGLMPRLLSDTGGNVRFIESVMHNLLEQDGLQHSKTGWQIDMAKLANIPASIKEAAKQSLARLSPDGVNLLQWAAIIGNTIDLDVLASVCGLKAADMMQQLGRAKQQHLLQIREQARENHYHFSNEHLREAIYNTLTDEQIQTRHLTVGQTLQAHYDENKIAEALAWHFNQAAQIPLALKYAKLAGDKARSLYANDLAIQQYSHALTLLHTQADLRDPDTEYAILDGREICYGLMGNPQAQQADLKAMVALAEKMEDPEKEIRATIRQATLYVNIGDYKDAVKEAKRILPLSEKIGNIKQKADCLSIMGRGYYHLGDAANAISYCEQARTLYQSVNHKLGIAESSRWLAAQALRNGQLGQAKKQLKQVLLTQRELGNRRGEADALNGLGVANMKHDYAKTRHYYEQSLKIVEAIGDRNGQSRIYNNLGIVYWSIGLYNRARDYLLQAIQISRNTKNRYQVSVFLETLGRIYFSLGDYTQAQLTFQEGLTLVNEIGDQHAAALYRFMMGRVAIVRQDFERSKTLFLGASQELHNLNAPGEMATVLSWLSTIYLALGDWEKANQQSREALEFLEAAGGKSLEYPTQDVWWNHYQILKANPSRSTDQAIDDEAWQALQNARRELLDVISSLGDEGLRRNYLNKVEINRKIIAEWIRQAQHRGHSSEEVLENNSPQIKDPATISPALLEERLKRILTISTRMSEMHEVEPLLEYTMDEVIELTGAERSFLVLIDQTGRPEFKVTRGVANNDLQAIQTQISYSVIGTVVQTRTPVLLQDALTHERFSHQISVLDLNLRSVLCVPLISRGQLIGVIYLDNRAVSGRFTQADVDLMALFATQAATAIENAHLYEELEDWAQTMETRVEQRTTELHEANVAISGYVDQLEISSQVAQQVSSILNPEHLLHAVAKLIQSGFGYYFVGIWLLDQRGDIIVLRAFAGNSVDETLKTGFRIPLEKTSITAQTCMTGQAQLVNDVQQSQDFLGINALPNTQSELSLPLQQGGKTIGTLDIQSDKVSDFSLEDQLVLQTLANQIAIAINNARHYQQMQRRANEMTTLTEIGHEISATLDLNTVLERIATYAQHLLQASSTALYLLTPDGKALRASVSLGQYAEEMKAHDIILGQGIVGSIVEAGSAEIVDNLDEDPRAKHIPGTPTEDEWLETLMCASLTAKGQIIGGMALWRYKSNGLFSQAEFDFLLGLSRQATIAIENARFFEAMQHAKLEAEAASQAKSAFLANMSHELRTPLNAILGFAQLMVRDQTLTQEQRKTLGVINRSGEHLLALINDVLEMSKIEAGRTTLTISPFDLYRLLDDMENMLHLRAANKGLTLQFKRNPAVPQFVQTDQGKLRQVLINLLSNAIKFTEKGRIILRSDYQQIGNRLSFEIDDTGLGIAPEDIETLFEAFVQTNTGQHAQEGTGLGLPISQQFVRLMGGDIKVSSQLGQGSVFKFDIAIKVANENEVNLEQPTRQVIGLAPNQDTYRILVVEDKWENRTLLVELLESIGFSVREANNGQEAIDIWKTWHPHLIWMDIRMPVMDGYKATKHIKNTPRGKETIIIALTASVLDEDRSIVLDAGCDDFVHKPFRETEIFDKIAQYLGTRYIYRELSKDEHDVLLDDDASEKKRFQEPLSSADLASLPINWVASLHQAALQVDRRRINDIIKKIEDQNPAIAGSLNNLVKAFRFDKILALTEKVIQP